ncbi:hypothetical protein LTR53_004892 [Teratosphaeriaceae sp. CCFEE 6253]|nr:hypothetical protein LTR53_004892 [Teratosphaeriaceae sp. CCFEE 6253]
MSSPPNKTHAPTPIHLTSTHISTLPTESFPDRKTNGNVTWKTLFSAPGTATDTFTSGIATCQPGSSTSCPGDLKAHRHSYAELYHIVSGQGVLTIEGVEHAVSAGSVLFIPGDAEHGVKCTGTEELVWWYVFAARAFEEVVYRFSEAGEQGRVLGKAKL